MYKAYGEIYYTFNNETMYTTEGQVKPIEIIAEVKKVSYNDLIKLIEELYPHLKIISTDSKKGIIKAQCKYITDKKIYYEYSTNDTYIIIPKNENLPPKIFFKEIIIDNSHRLKAVDEVCTDIPKWFNIENYM